MSDNFCILCGEMIPEGRQVCPSCENKVLHKAIHPKYNVGDVVYCYSCFNGELFPGKEPYVIYEVVVSTSAFGTKIFYRVKRTVDTVQTYDIFSERQCFETYEKCAHHCSTYNEL